MILESHVDIKVQQFCDWKKALLKEDIRELGSEVKRPAGALYDLYLAYCRAQRSDEYQAIRDKM